MLVIIIILSVLLVSSIFAIFNVLQKLEKYEDFIENEIKKNQNLLQSIRKLDQKEMFEKDDDVGSVFAEIKQTIERYKNFK